MNGSRLVNSFCYVCPFFFFFFFWKNAIYWKRTERNFAHGMENASVLGTACLSGCALDISSHTTENTLLFLRWEISELCAHVKGFDLMALATHLYVTSAPQQTRFCHLLPSVSVLFCWKDMMLIRDKHKSSGLYWTWTISNIDYPENLTFMIHSLMAFS